MGTEVKIACFGDSHVSIFNGDKSLIPVERLTKSNNFVIYHFGPWLAYRLPERIREFREILSKIDRSIVQYELLMFGEIDCRAQVKKVSTMQNRKPDDVIAEIVGHYIAFINEVMDPKRLIVVGVPPCYMESPYEEYYKNNEGVDDRPRGTMKERNLYKKKFNQMMKNYCKSAGIKFISIFDEINKNPNKSTLYMDEIHLNPLAVKEFIDKALMKAKL